MAKTYEERAAAAETDPRSRLTSVSELIEEGAELVEQQRAILAQATGDSVDFRLSEADREEAAARAEKARRRTATLTAAVEALTAKLAERRASDKTRAIEAERAAALAERAEIAERFGAIVPEAVAAMTGLFVEVQANAERMQKAGLKERNAEAIARGVKNHYAGNAPVEWFASMRIPNFGGPGRAWPVERFVDIRASDAKAQAAARQARADHAALWGAYRAVPLGGRAIRFQARVTPGLPGEKTVLLVHRDNELSAFAGEIRHAEVERLRALGVDVKAVDPAELLEKEIEVAE